MQPIFFVHIPKTAGTSLNVAAEQYFDGNKIEKDYGPSSDATTPLVHTNIYAENAGGAYALHQAIIGNNIKWLTGHVFAERYVHLVGAENTLSFVRDPVARVISEYHHRVRHFDLKRDFTEFYRDPAETNKQFRMIGELAWQAFHLVGTIEHYTDCLALLAQTKNLPLPVMQTNISPDKPDLHISEETRTDIKKWNERDCLFVEQVRTYLSKRLETYAQGQAFCFHDSGFVPDQHIIGWAFYEGDPAPVDVGLFIDEVLVQTTKATEYRLELKQLLTPRAGHNGYRFVLSDYASAQHVEVKALKTAQTLLRWQRSH